MSDAVATPEPGPSLSAVAAGLLAAFVGFASAFPILVSGILAVGATKAEAASGLMAASLAMAFCAMILSARLRMPVSIAWSTPGAALMAATGAVPGGFPAAVGAFVVAGALVVAAGSIKPLGRAVAAIPTPLASAMLAGVLLPLCLAPFKAIAEIPTLGLPIVLAWAVMARINRILAVPVAVGVTAVLIAATTVMPPGAFADLVPRPVLVVPSFDLSALVSIAVPLFIVTMASQNIPGIAVLAVNGYRPDPGSLFRWTGVFSILAAPFGSPAVNLAAVTAAMCAGPDADPDPRRRWWAAFVGGVAYLGLGLAAPLATAFLAVAPPLLIQAVAGLGLMGALAAALSGALSEPAKREAALVTFLMTASGMTFLGIGGAVWGLLGGGAMLLLARFRA